MAHGEIAVTTELVRRNIRLVGLDYHMNSKEIIEVDLSQ